MEKPESIVARLVSLTAELGDPRNDYAILGEGNTSARIDGESFYVKASGAEMRSADASSFTRVSFKKILAFLDGGPATDDGVGKALLDAKLDSDSNPKKPSVETFIHAIALTLGRAAFVGHTHPVAVNAVLCSAKAREAFGGRLFPDEIVVCGPAYAFVPYTDPGLPLAIKVRGAIENHLRAHGEPPRVILMQNHGMIALGSSPGQVLMITAMMVKTARIIAGAYAMGGPAFLAVESVNRIHTRPDELHRRKVLADKG